MRSVSAPNQTVAATPMPDAIIRAARVTGRSASFSLVRYESTKVTVTA